MIIGLTDENDERNADEQCVLTKDFLVDISLTDKKDHAKRERYRDYVQSMLVLGEGEAVIDLGVSAEDTTKRGVNCLNEHLNQLTF